MGLVASVWNRADIQLFPTLQKVLLDSIALGPISLISQKPLEARSSVYFVDEETKAQKISLKSCVEFEHRSV